MNYNMKKVKKRYIVLPVLGILIVLIVLFINIDNIRYMFLPKYNYEREENAVFGKVYMDEEVYEEITEKAFININNKLIAQGINPYDNTLIGRIDYIDYTIWKYRLCGNQDKEYRILLTGEEAYSFNDANFPEVYFCRQDILDSLSE